MAVEKCPRSLNLTEIWQKQNKVCFHKKFEIVIILPQNISNSSAVGCGNGGGDGGGGLVGGSGGDASGGDDDGAVFMVVVVVK